ncbi:MAG: hypothetical protein NZ900_08195 [Synergistetes bacterium]|nr:hypothetical protein [Synergistota bacterium]MDW8192898.1 four-carbon acid sugar kinase family protein [Synergistota bacterium]
MVKIGVIADDLTGANALGALLSKRGLSSVSVLDPSLLSERSQVKRDIIVISTSSRYLPPQEAYAKVSETFRLLLSLGCNFFSKRIDTTLRGSIGHEVDAMLDSSGEIKHAIMVPVFPAAGRICLGGHVLVNSIPLDETEVIRESVFRFNTSNAVKIIGSQTKRKVIHIPYDIVRSEESLLEAFNSLPEESFAVFDAVTDADVDRIATISLKWGRPFIPVDPGPFTASLASKKLGGRIVFPKILIVIGSVTELIRKQVEYLSRSYDIKWIKLDVRKLASSPEEEIMVKSDKVSEFVKLHSFIGLTTVQSEDDVVSPEEAERLGFGKGFYSKVNEAIGAVVLRVLKENKDLIKGIYVSGGDTVTAIVKGLGAYGISVKDEVYPLAAFGSVVGGEFDGLPLVTKGGLVGKEDTIKVCVDYLLRSIGR